MNLCGKNKSVTAYLKKLEKINQEEDMILFLNELDLTDLPFFQNITSKNNKKYYNLSFMALLSGNSQLLDKILTIFPESLNNVLLIENEQNYTWENISNVLDPKIVEILIQKVAFHNENHNILNKHNILGEIILKCIENDKTRNKKFSEYISESVLKYYFDNQIKNESGVYLFYKNMNFHVNNKYKHTPESYDKLKIMHNFFIGVPSIFNDEKMINDFFKHPEMCFFNDFIKYHKVKDAKNNQILKIIPYSIFQNINAPNLIDNNASLDLLIKIEPFFNDTNHLIRDQEIHDIYVKIFNTTDQDFGNFYSDLNKKYSFLLPLSNLNISNIENIKTVIKSYPHEVGKKEINGLIQRIVEPKNTKVPTKLLLIEKLLNSKNVNAIEVSGSIINNFIKFDLLEPNNEYIEFINKILTKMNIDIEKINIDGTSQNKSRVLMENYLINKMMNKEAVLNHKIKKRL